MRLADLRYSTGLSFNWNSPMGPLKINYAMPLNSKPDDRIQRVQFNIGSVF
jgi:outer membrane protein insertion porin family